MAKKWITAVFTACLLIVSVLGVVVAQTKTIDVSQDVVHILPDGTVTPLTAPIHRNGDLYQLTDNINAAIVIEKNNITLDGRGFAIQGKEPDRVNSPVAINLTCMGVTVENIKFEDWWVGVLGVYDGNRIVGNDFRDVGISIAVYASNYEITGNFLEYVRIVGANIHICNNEINVREYQSGFWVSNCTNLTVEANNIKFTNKTTSFISLSGDSSVSVYHNNFLNPEALQFSRGQFYLFGMSGISDLEPWDNGYPSGGNCWSDYTTRYSGASVADESGIWDTEYVVQVTNTYVLKDRYPLQNPYPIEVAALPTPPPAGSIDSPAPSVPEFSIWATLALLATAASAVVALKRKQKNP
jgi:hypothetical protein